VQNEMEIFTPEEGEIPGAQGGGEVGLGIELLKNRVQLRLREGAAVSGRAGKNKFLGSGFGAGDHALGAVLFHGLLQAQLQTAPGQSAGDEDTAVRGMGGEELGEEEGDPQLGEFLGEQTDQINI
jgi:hypothetical protein